MAASIDLTGSIQARMVEGTTRVLTIDNRPDNRLHPALMAELQDAIESADADSGVTGIVLTGAGAVFCGGLDLPALRAGADPAEFAGALVALLRVFPELGTPIVAVVNGDALAAGASLIAACDVATGRPGGTHRHLRGERGGLADDRAGPADPPHRGPGRDGECRCR